MTTKLCDLLKASDEELFTGEACHVYAIELKKRWPRLTTRHAGNADAIGSTKAMHVYAALGEYKIDVSGPVNELEYLRSKNYAAWDVSVDQLMAVDPEESSSTEPRNHWRHNLDPEFVSCASERARRHIEQQLPQWRSIVESKDQVIDPHLPSRYRRCRELPSRRQRCDRDKGLRARSG
jgi:hypothetical protein